MKSSLNQKEINKDLAKGVSERVYLSVESLCTGGKSLPYRLRHVYGYLEVLHVHEFPATLQNDFKFIMKNLEKYLPKDSYEDIIFDTKMPRMRNVTGKKIAERVLYLNTQLDEILNNII